MVLGTAPGPAVEPSGGDAGPAPLARASGDNGPPPEATTPEATAPRLPEKAPPLSAVVLKTCKDPDCAANAMAEFHLDPLAYLSLSEGYPRVLTEAESPGLGAGVHLVVLGLCRNELALSPEFKDPYPDITHRQIEAVALPESCPTLRAPQSDPAVEVRQHPDFSVNCGRSKCDIDFLAGNTAQWYPAAVNVSRALVDRLTVSRVGPLFQLRAGCGTACVVTILVDPRNGQRSRGDEPMVHAVDPTHGILAFGIHSLLFVRPIFFDPDRDKFADFELDWAMNAEESIESCKFLPGRKLRVLYHTKRAGLARKVLDVPAHVYR
jgi:hypothetical protein